MAELSTNAPTKEDLIFLVNKDRVTGKVRKLQYGLLTVATPQTQLDIPLARVSQIALGSPVTNAPPNNPWELRAFFAGGGTVAFRLDDCSQGRIAGTSPNFGKVDFKSESIRQLQFNLGRAKPGPEDVEILDQEIWDFE